MDEYLHVKQRIAASLSPPVEDTLFYRYRYGPGGYVDMAPKMELRIERDFFDHRSSGHTPSGYLGTAITYYDVLGSTGTSLKLLRVEKRSAGSMAFGSNSSDAALAKEFATTARQHLFLQDLAVSGDAKTPAILIGGALDQDLNGATHAIENDPGISCEALLSWQITCALFDGVVTVSPMLEVCAPVGMTNCRVAAHLGSGEDGGTESNNEGPMTTKKLIWTSMIALKPHGTPVNCANVRDALVSGDRAH